MKLFSCQHACMAFPGYRVPTVRLHQLFPALMHGQHGIGHLPQTSSYASTPAAHTSTGGPYGLTPLADSMDRSTALLSWKGTEGFFSTCSMAHNVGGDV